MSINDHLILSPERREQLENDALKTSMLLATGQAVDERDDAIAALVNHINALDARAENYARIFGNIDKLADVWAEAEADDEPTVKFSTVGKALQKLIAEAIAPTTPTEETE